MAALQSWPDVSSEGLLAVSHHFLILSLPLCLSLSPSLCPSLCPSLSFSLSLTHKHTHLLFFWMPYPCVHLWSLAWYIYICDTRERKSRNYLENVEICGQADQQTRQEKKSKKNTLRVIQNIDLCKNVCLPYFLPVRFWQSLLSLCSIMLAGSWETGWLILQAEGTALTCLSAFTCTLSS